MRRLGWSLLVAYTATVTVIAACMACRVHVIQRIYTRFIFGRMSGVPIESFETSRTVPGSA